MQTEEAKSKFPIFSKRFYELRGKMSQADFAVFLGISRPTVGFYENGERLPDALVLKKISEKCGVPSDWLLGLTDNRETKNIEIGNALGLSDAAIGMLEEFKDRPALSCLLEREDLVAKILAFLYANPLPGNFALLSSGEIQLIPQNAPEQKDEIKRLSSAALVEEVLISELMASLREQKPGIQKQAWDLERQRYYEDHPQKEGAENGEHHEADE